MNSVCHLLRGQIAIKKGALALAERRRLILVWDPLSKGEAPFLSCRRQAHLKCLQSRPPFWNSGLLRGRTRPRASQRFGQYLVISTRSLDTCSTIWTVSHSSALATFRKALSLAFHLCSDRTHWLVRISAVQSTARREPGRILGSDSRNLRFQIHGLWLHLGEGIRRVPLSGPVAFLA